MSVGEKGAFITLFNKGSKAEFGSRSEKGFVVAITFVSINL